MDEALIFKFHRFVSITISYNILYHKCDGH